MNLEEDDNNPYFQHLERRVQAAAEFHRQEARSMLRLVVHDRSRRFMTFENGDIVYYFRKGKKGNRRGEI